MTGSAPNRQALEDLWRQRLNDAKLRLDFALNYMQEVQRDYPADDIPDGEYHFSHQQALHGENLARAQYNRILHIYTDLIARGIIPDEDEWLKSQADRA